MLHMKKTSQLLQRPVIVCFLALLCTALWGSAFPCIKTGYRLFHIASEDTASQLLFAGMRFFLAGILVILFGSLLQRKVLLFRKSALPKIGVVSLFQTILQYVFFYIGLAHTTAVKSSIFGGTGVLFSILFVCLIFRQEKLTSSKLAGCILGFSGIFLISFQNLRSLDFGFSWNGEGALLISNIANALSPIFLKKFSKTENSVMLSGYQFLFGGLCISVIGVLAGGHLSFQGFSPVLLMIYMAMISAVAYTVWGILLQYNPVSKVTVYGFMNQVFGVFLSAIILKEWDEIRLQTIAALLLVCSGIYFVNRKKEAKV